MTRRHATRAPRAGRARRVVVYLTDDEHQLLVTRATAAGESVSKYASSRLLDGLTTAAPARQDYDVPLFEEDSRA